MSKSKGNVIDPSEVIDQYGADALRFTLAAMAAQGRDIKLSTQRVEGYRNFATKLWNAARFAEMNECVRADGFDPKATVKETLNRWIAGEVERTAAAVTAGIEAYKFNEAATAIYEFTWGTFCDWYLELAKPILNGEEAGQGRDARHRGLGARPDPEAAASLHAVHHRGAVGAPGRGRGRARPRSCSSPWPVFEGLADAEADEEIGWLVKLVSEVRSVRSEMNVPAGAKIPLVLVGANKATRARRVHEDTIKRLARIDAISFAKAPPKGSARSCWARRRRRCRSPASSTWAPSGAAGARDRQGQGRDQEGRRQAGEARASSPRRRPRWSRRTASAAPTSRRRSPSCRRR